MFRRPPQPKRTDPLFPSTTLFRTLKTSDLGAIGIVVPQRRVAVALIARERLGALDFVPDQPALRHHPALAREQELGIIPAFVLLTDQDRKSTRLNSSH